MVRKERGFFGKLIVFLLTVLAFIGLAAMGLSIACPYINPKHFVWIAYFGLAFWEIFAFNVLVFILLLLMWSRNVWIAVLALVISIPGIQKSFAFGHTKESAPESMKVMSYNVHYFQHVDKEKNTEDFIAQIVNLVREQSPDVLCCQEFSAFNPRRTRPQCIADFAEIVGMPYVYYNRKSNYGGNVIFSKYPVQKVTEDSGFGQENTYGVMVSVDAGERGLFHVANIHLVSYSLTNAEINAITNSHEIHNSLDTVGVKVIQKLKRAYELRSDEVVRMLEGMPPVDGPVIVCGDFNDTPLSYVYRQMQKAGFTDTFIKAGRGIKPTYGGKLPLLRIDYVWANDEVQPLRFNRNHIKASDHYPVLLEFTLNPSKLKTID